MLSVYYAVSLALVCSLTSSVPVGTPRANSHEYEVDENHHVPHLEAATGSMPWDLYPLQYDQNFYGPSDTFLHSNNDPHNSVYHDETYGQSPLWQQPEANLFSNNWNPHIEQGVQHQSDVLHHQFHPEDMSHQLEAHDSPVYPGYTIDAVQATDQAGFHYEDDHSGSHHETSNAAYHEKEEDDAIDPQAFIGIDPPSEEEILNRSFRLNEYSWQRRIKQEPLLDMYSQFTHIWGPLLAASREVSINKVNYLLQANQGLIFPLLQHDPEVLKDVAFEARKSMGNKKKPLTEEQKAVLQTPEMTIQWLKNSKTTAEKIQASLKPNKRIKTGRRPKWAPERLDKGKREQLLKRLEGMWKDDRSNIKNMLNGMHVSLVDKYVDDIFNTDRSISHQAAANLLQESKKRRYSVGNTHWNELQLRHGTNRLERSQQPNDQHGGHEGQSSQASHFSSLPHDAYNWPPNLFQNFHIGEQPEEINRQYPTWGHNADAGPSH